MADNVVKSRYEIINELVAKKTIIIDEVASLEKAVQTNAANLEQKKRDQARVIEDKQREDARDIVDFEAGHKGLVESTKKQVATRETKITALNDAIEAIKSISKPADK